MEHEIDTRSTINEYVKRFREAPPAPSSDRYNPADNESLHCDWFWWLSPKESKGVETLREDNVEVDELSTSESDAVSIKSLRHRGNEDFRKKTDELLKKCDMILQNHSSNVTGRTQPSSMENDSIDVSHVTCIQSNITYEGTSDDCRVEGVDEGVEDIVSPWMSLDVHNFIPTHSVLNSSRSYSDDTKSPHEDKTSISPSVGPKVDIMGGLGGAPEIEEGYSGGSGQNIDQLNDFHDRSDEVFAFLHESPHSSIKMTSSVPPMMVADNVTDFGDMMIDRNKRNELAKGIQNDETDTVNVPDETVVKSNGNLDHRIRKSYCSEMTECMGSSEIAESTFFESSVATCDRSGNDVLGGVCCEPNLIHPLLSTVAHPIGEDTHPESESLSERECSLMSTDVVEPFLDDEVVSTLWMRLQSVRGEISRHQRNPGTTEI